MAGSGSPHDPRRRSVSEPEDVRRRTDREAGGTKTFYLLISQPEILNWLELSEQELAAWLVPEEKDAADDDEERAA
jgi:hypothetical protein